jgi:hypothetical protein
MAYAPAGFSASVTDPTPAAGVPFTVHATGANAKQAVTLTMAPDPASIGTKSLTQIANAQGVVDFAVTLTEDGTYVLVSASASGAVLSTQTVTVADRGAVLIAGASATAGAGAGTPVGGQLSHTGFQGMGLAVGGGVLVLAGVSLVLVSQRPRVSRVSKP